MLTIASSHMIFLTRHLYTSQNPDSQKYDRTRHDPVCGHVQQVRGINQADDDDRESTRVKTEGHRISSPNTSSPGLAGSVQKETHRDRGSIGGRTALRGYFRSWYAALVNSHSRSLAAPPVQGCFFILGKNEKKI